MNKDEQITIEKLYTFYSTLEWPGLSQYDDSILLGDKNGQVLATISSSTITIHLIWRDTVTGRIDTARGIKNIVIDKNINLEEFLYIGKGQVKVSFYTEIRQIFGIPYETETLNISKKNKKHYFDESDKTFYIPFKKYFDILVDARQISKTVSSYSKSVRRYKVNQTIEKYFNREIQRTTYIEKGEFYFLIHRLNIETKKKVEDFKKFLDDSDIDSLQRFVKIAVEKEVFDKNFLRELDAYFIREKLKDIITLGSKLLNLASTNLRTDRGKELVTELSIGRKKVKQFETLWQVYFEKYLLYLIFTYKEIYPKVKLKIVGERKYPDFIGVNHYNGIDVIEIKTHLTPALVWDKSHKNFAFSSELSKSIIQTMNYMDGLKSHGFKDPSEKEKIIETTSEENLYRPRGIIIISSKKYLVKRCRDYDKSKVDRDFTKLRNSLHNIEILTFDEVIDIAKNYSEKIVKNKIKEL